MICFLNLTFPKIFNDQFWGLAVFPEEKGHVPLDVSKTHKLPTKMTLFLLRSASLTINYSFTIPFHWKLRQSVFLFWDGQLANADTVSGAGRIFFSKQLNGCSFDPGGFFFWFLRARFVMSTLFIKKGTFNHCGWAKASLIEHHEKYVFQTAFFMRNKQNE